jgi:hypothetical protein
MTATITHTTGRWGWACAWCGEPQVFKSKAPNYDILVAVIPADRLRPLSRAFRPLTPAVPNPSQGVGSLMDPMQVAPMLPPARKVEAISRKRGPAIRVAAVRLTR